jgi:5-bromo-4-chloroindolyl phosphate hydrolysis protein
MLVSILDENFDMIKSKEMMGVVGCALKDENEIYLVDSINSCIYIIDSEMKIKVKNPKTIFWVNELFYVNDDDKC